MKINGVEVNIKKCDDNFLTTRLGAIQGTLKVAYTVLGVLAGVCLLFVLFMGIQYGLSFGFQMLLLALAFLLVVSLIFFLPLRVLLKEQKAIKAEIAQRVKSRNGNTDIEAVLKLKSKRATIVIVCIIAVIVVIACSVLLSAFEGSKSSSSHSEKCRNCGRKTSLVAGYDYCSDCYESFVDWQEDNWTEDD